MTWEDSDDPPREASTGALRWMSMNVEMNGAERCCDKVRACRIERFVVPFPLLNILEFVECSVARTMRRQTAEVAELSSVTRLQPTLAFAPWRVDPGRLLDLDAHHKDLGQPMEDESRWQDDDYHWVRCQTSPIAGRYAASAMLLGAEFILGNIA